MESITKLRFIKIVHTLVWAIFAGSIFAIPVFAYLNQLSIALFLILLVMIEVLVLAINKMRCPLTDVAGKFTNETRANFDIYLPEWLAKYNKTIFGWLYIIGIVYSLMIWIL